MKLFARFFRMYMPFYSLRSVLSTFLLLVVCQLSTSAQQSVLANGNWKKIKVSRTGIYRMSFGQLQAMGLDPSQLRVFGYADGDLPENSNTQLYDDLPERKLYKGNDFVLMYLHGPNGLYYDATDNMLMQKPHSYSDYAYYFLTSDYNSGFDNLITQTTNTDNGAHEVIASFTDLVYHESDTTNLLFSGREWYGEIFSLNTSYSFNFPVTGLVAGSPVTIKTNVIGRAQTPSSFTVQTGSQEANVPIGAVSYDYAATYAKANYALMNTTASGSSVNVNITYNKPSSEAEGWLDYITLNVQRQLQLYGSQTVFRYINTTGSDKIIDFEPTGNNLTIWNVTDIQAISALPSYDISGKKRFQALNNNELNEYVLFDVTASLPAPITEGSDVGVVVNQNLHNLQNPDFIIVTHPEFLPQATEIAQIHQQRDSLQSVVVTIQQVYNEFSSGMPDATAIRNFVKMFYDRASANNSLKMPRYLLLMGDASVDYKLKSANNPNFVPTYQSAYSLSPTQSFASDDYFGILDNGESIVNGNIDVGVGRIPVKNKQEADNAVAKIRQYLAQTSQGDWRNQLCFIADDADKSEIIHMYDANRLADNVVEYYPTFNVEKLYLDAYPQVSSSGGQRYPDVKQAITRRVNNGSLIVNYTGHGNENVLTDERVIEVSDIQSWSNFERLAVFMTATCEFSRFDHFSRSENMSLTTAGEKLFLNPQGGAIALFTTTRLVYASSNYELNQNFYKYVFTRNPDNSALRLGDIMRLAKRATSSNINQRNFTLLGDPAIQLPLPRLNVVADSVNHYAVSDRIDTISAFETVTISGHIATHNGTLVSNFDGYVFPTVFDKTDTMETLRNDGASALRFTQQANMLYTGKSRVKNGRFQFSFVVPKDIAYNYGRGKLSFYAYPDSSSAQKYDAAGYSFDFIVGGTYQQTELDTVGPQIRLFMNDTLFVNGGVTDQQPTLLAFVSDPSGINTAASGIGHDITALVDKKMLVLNDAYEADNNGYQSGVIRYQLSSLTDGEHTLRLKVWDTHNNSSTAEITFEVINSNMFVIKNVSNYPNPIDKGFTRFVFEHNRPDETMEVILQVYATTGALLYETTQNITSEGFRNIPIEWNVRTNNDGALQRGLYIYTVTATSADGQTMVKQGKLVVMNGQ